MVRGKKYLHQRKIAKILILSGFVLTLGFIWACAPPAVKTTALIPARFHEASMLKEVEVLPFGGKDCKEFTAEFEARLANINIGDKQYFTVVDRAKITKVMGEEITLTQTGFVDTAKAAKIGKMIGAKGVYTGEITATNTSSVSPFPSLSRCIYR